MFVEIVGVYFYGGLSGFWIIETTDCYIFSVDFSFRKGREKLYFGSPFTAVVL